MTKGLRVIVNESGFSGTVQEKFPAAYGLSEDVEECATKVVNAFSFCKHVAIKMFWLNPS
jgi:hypothetical protein